MKTPAAGL